MFLDRAAQFPEAAHRAFADLARFLVDRDPAAIVRGVGDLARRSGRGDRLCERHRGCIEGQRIARAQSGHRIEEQRKVGNVACHRSLHRQRRPQIVRRAARHPARRRPQPDDRTIGRRPAQRSAVIGAVRQPHLAGGQCDRAAAGGSAAGQRRVPRIAGAAEHLVERAAAGAEFRRVRLGDHDAALAFDALHHRMRRRGHVIAEDRRTIRRAHARDVGQVLDRHRQTGEPAGLVCGLATGPVHQSLCMIARAIETQCRQRIHRWLHRGDARGGRLDQIER